MFAVDRTGRIRVANDEARRLLGPGVRPGTPIAEAGLPDRLLALLGERLQPGEQSGEQPPPEPAGTGPAVLVAGDRALLCHAAPA